MRAPGIAYVLGAGAAVAMVALAMTVSREFLPELDEGALFLHGEMTGGISLAKAMEMDTELRKTVLEFPEIKTVVTHIGRNDDGTDPNTPSHLEAGIALHPHNTWPPGETKHDLIRRMQARLAELPGYELTFSQPILDAVKDKVFDPHSALAVKAPNGVAPRFTEPQLKVNAEADGASGLVVVRYLDAACCSRLRR